jgi:hypothetical protein
MLLYIYIYMDLGDETKQEIVDGLETKLSIYEDNESESLRINTYIRIFLNEYIRMCI